MTEGYNILAVIAAARQKTQCGHVIKNLQRIANKKAGSMSRI